MTRDRLAIHDEDAELVIAWRRGEFSAFEELVRKYQKRMLNIAYRCVGDYEAACEVVQDAFAAAYRGGESFRGAARFSTWLTGITVSLSRNRLPQSRNKRSSEAYPPGAPPADFTGGAHREHPSPSAPEQLEMLDLSEKLHGCIGALDADSREMIVLRDVQGLTYEEICAILVIREGTVKTRLSRAREMAKDCLKRAAGAL